jgi:heme/copper-type cytochrome/quinol oxidase subunit 3
MNGVILGFGIAIGIVLFLVVVRILFSALIKGFLASLSFQAWSRRHPAADAVLFCVTALLMVGGIVLWILRTSK